MWAKKRLTVLGKQQRADEVLRVLQNWYAEHKEYPVRRQIAAELGISVSTVQRYLDMMRDDRHIRLGHSGRVIDILKPIG